MKKLFKLLKSKLISKKPQFTFSKNQPRIYVCEEISNSQISKNALKVIHELKKANYQAYLVGGSVRDLLLGIKPKDFDVATNANPEEIKSLFKRAQLIGRRFQIVHVCFSGEIIEVSTFRSLQTGDQQERLYTEHGFLIRDNLYGTIEEDAYRRDFTLNALYYDAMASQLIDYVGGYKDLKAHTIKIIGEPQIRYKEDPLRILRAIRLSAKLQMPIDSETEKPFKEMGYLLSHIPSARVLDELLKIYRSGHALDAVRLLKKHHLFKEIFSFISPLTADEELQMAEKMIETTLEHADQRISQKKTLSSGLLFAAFLWHSLQKKISEYKKNTSDNGYALSKAIHDTLGESIGLLSLTRKIKLMIREIWLLQYFLMKKKRRQIFYSFQHRYFRNAYHLLNFRIISGEKHLLPLYEWWTQFIAANKSEQAKLIEQKPDLS